jgi:hypothetical protein
MSHATSYASKVAAKTQGCGPTLRSSLRQTGEEKVNRDKGEFKTRVNHLKTKEKQFSNRDSLHFSLHLSFAPRTAFHRARASSAPDSHPSNLADTHTNSYSQLPIRRACLPVRQGSASRLPRAKSRGERVRRGGRAEGTLSNSGQPDSHALSVPDNRSNFYPQQPTNRNSRNPHRISEVKISTRNKMHPSQSKTLTFRTLQQRSPRIERYGDALPLTRCRSVANINPVMRIEE